MESPPEFEQAEPAARKKRKRKGPRKATKSHLENAALHYLGRFASSAENLRRVLMRKVQRSAHFHGTDPEEGAGYVDAIIVRYREVGLLDDQAFAEARAADLHRRGAPLKGIRFKLREKGLGAADIDWALAALEENLEGHDADRAAAVRLARRRRLGPYRSEDADIRRDFREKDLAALARAGFDYDTARWMIDMDHDEASGL